MKRKDTSRRRPKRVISFATRSDDQKTVQDTPHGQLLSLPNKQRKPLFQEDIEQLVALEMAAAEARAKYQVQRDCIRAALMAGVAVEPGCLRVRLVQKKNGHFDVKVTRYED